MRRTTWGGRALWLAVGFAAIAAGDSRSLLAQAIPLGPQHESYRRRVDTAAGESRAQLTEWLGPIPARDQPLELDLPWRSAPSAMEVESQVSYGLARLWWPGVAPDAAPVVNGLAWYLQSRNVERLYDFAFLNPGHSSDAVRFFGGAVPWEFPLLRMSRWTSGLARPEFLGRQRPWPAPARRLPASLDRAAIRTALGFGSLERIIGWPALQGALFESSRRAQSGPMTRAQLLDVIGAAAGQDVSWVFDLAANAAAVFDYAIWSMSSVPCPQAACVVTKIGVVRLGDGVFSGTARSPAGEFESGDAIEIQVDFADGSRASARWDGRAPAREFEFQSAAAPVAAHLDPNRVLLLDANSLNHDLASSPTNVPIRKWVARWLVWVQDATLTYASLF